MKKLWITVAFAALLGTLNVSCQKENTTEPLIGVKEACEVHNMQYTIDGATYSATLNGEEVYDAFIQHLVGLARNGHSVTFWDTDKYQGASASKEVVVYTTTSKEDAVGWAKEMVDNGYKVTISFDEHTGVFTCIASR